MKNTAKVSAYMGLVIALLIIGGIAAGIYAQWAVTQQRHDMEQQIITRCQDIWANGNVKIEPVDAWFGKTHRFTVTVMVGDDIVFFVQDEKALPIFQQLNAIDYDLSRNGGGRD